MDEVERAAKLRLIARLNAEELRGWVWARGVDGRPWFDGELAALMERARMLGVEIGGAGR